MKANCFDFVSMRQRKTLALVRGNLSRLQIEDTEENFVSTAGTGVAAGAAMLGLSAAGLGGAATGALHASSGGNDDVQTFIGVVDGKRIAGKFSKVWFADGDYLECAGELQADGSYIVFAVRRPSDQTLWMFPHCSRGSKTHWRFAMKMSAISAVLLTSFLIVILMFYYGFALWNNEDSYDGVVVFTIMGIVLSVYCTLKIAIKWKPFIAIAESVFAAFGYADPAEVDMEQQDTAFRKNLAPGMNQPLYVPWVYRYLK